MSNPDIQYRTIVQDSGDPGYVNRVLVGTPTRGTVRIEWVMARYGQVIPTNWSSVQILEFLDSYIPLRYQVADAQNLIVKETIERDFQWLLLIEDDDVLPPDAFLRFNTYMREAKVPVVSGLYYTKSVPSEPLVYRGQGTSFYDKWKFGDLIYCDGVPTGCLLIHVGVLRAMWNDSEVYQCRGITTRRVFETPRIVAVDPETQEFNTMVGTSDLHWSKRVVDGDYLRKAGWNDYMDSLEDPKYPLIIDTNIFCRHVDESGRMYP